MDGVDARGTGAAPGGRGACPGERDHGDRPGAALAGAAGPRRVRPARPYLEPDPVAPAGGGGAAAQLRLDGLPRCALR
ncbi:hypothetical protein HD593_006172 [Nonomuraea rubra]|uniref:Uncharacterized protein n=1 Tax=Nonomuraea rubra TaxID=46180 RepID=A0A7X0NXH0_9ACTN|nr:hypothetical protein [Nonomuraea rubra]